MVYAEFRTSSGVLIRLHDDLLPEPGSDEERRREERTAQVISWIDESNAEEQTA